MPSLNTERDFIQRFLAPLARQCSGAHGLLDDAATLELGEGCQLVATVDAVSEGTHFFSDDAPADIGWKALAVNISDLVAKGAEPIAYLMSLTFPESPNARWTTAFCSGLGAAQSVFKVNLAGGDTDIRPGPLTVTITALGRVAPDAFVKRGGGQDGDILFLTGTIGDAGAGLQVRRRARNGDPVPLNQDSADFLLNRYHRPKPRTRLIPILSKYAHAAIDISDGLVKDGRALAMASGLGGCITCTDLPISDPASEAVAGGILTAEALITSGGDYEVLAAVAADQGDAFRHEAENAGVVVTPIGKLANGNELVFEGADGQPLTIDDPGYDHFTA